jgi:hypothetical protein
MAGFVLLFQSMEVVAASIALVVIWSRAGWTTERAQFLGVIWIGVSLVLAFLAWVSVNVVRWQERSPLFTPRDRQTS